VVSRIGGQYDLAHALALARRLLRLPLASRLAQAPAASATRFIVGSPIVPDESFVTPHDFEAPSALEPVTMSAGE
jgi:hypothetical protein